MILFSDFDDTLFTHDNSEQFSANLAAVQKFRKAGNQFCIITGRELLSLKNSLPNLSEYCDYIILNNGAVAVDSAEQVIFTLPMKRAEVETLIDALVSVPNFSKLSPVYYYDLDSGEHLAEDITKIRLWVESNELAEAQTREIKSQFHDVFQIFTYHNMQPRRSWIPANYEAFSEVISAHAGKETAVADLASIFNFPNSEIITVGDDWNDLKMIQKFNGYVVANAKPEILSHIASSHVTSSVAELIDNLLK